MTESVDSLWAREGDMAQAWWNDDFWSPFSSGIRHEDRSLARTYYHGFDFRVESENGTKRIVKTGGDQ